jgi:hypothetical protein
LFVLLAIAGLIGRPSNSGSVEPQSESWSPPAAARIIRYLVLLTTGPLLLTVIGAALSGASLKVAWSSSFFNYAGILAIAITSRRFSEEALRRIAACAGALLIIFPLGYAMVIFKWPSQSSGPLRVNWPQTEISRRFVELWSRETGEPLGIVSGSTWVAGLIGLTAADRPSILSGPDLAASPWVTPARLEQEGALVVWDARATRVPRLAIRLIGAAPVREERFSWRPSGDDGEIVIRYVIVPPSHNPR